MRAAFLALLAVLSASCGGAAPAPVARKAPPPRPAPAASCHAIVAHATALFTDAPAEERARLDAAMAKGLAVVAYDCRALRVLEGCSAMGDYAYAGTVPTDSLVRLESPDEIQANLPVTGATLGNALALELGSGFALELAARKIGRLTTTRRRVDREDLRGPCEGATHVVTAATLGASAFQLGSGARGASELLASATPSGDGVAAPTGQGSLDGCQAAKLDAAGPPAGCGAVLGLELRALGVDPGPEPSALPSDRPAIPRTCPGGLVAASGKCAAPSSEGHLCEPSDEKECRAQCERGSAASCSEAGRLECPATDCVAGAQKLAKRSFERACEGGEPVGCVNLGRHLSTYPSARGPDEPSAQAIFRRACEAGEQTACLVIPELSSADAPPPGRSPAAQTIDRAPERACRLGSTEGCGRAARLAAGRGDRKLETELARRACFGGDRASCLLAGERASSGLGTERDAELAKALWALGCGHTDLDLANGGAESCERLATALESDAQGADTARAIRERVCEHGGRAAVVADACATLGAASWRGDERHPRDPARAATRWRAACELGMPAGREACRMLALHELRGVELQRDVADAERLLRRGCQGAVDAPICAARGATLDVGAAIPEPAIAAAFLAAACDGSDAAGCLRLAHLRASGALDRKDRPGALTVASRALELFQRSCERGPWRLCLQAADMLREGDVVAASRAAAAPLEKKAFAGLEQDCERRTGGTCEELAHRLLRGRGVKRDSKRGVELLERACERTGNGCNTLGEVFRWGDGVPRDYARAARLYRRACAVSSTSACSNLASLYEEKKATAGAGDEPMTALFTRMCQGAGQRIACLRLGSLYARGDGVPRDDAKAATFWNRIAHSDVIDGLLSGCEDGAGDDCSGAGFLISRGLGVPKDRKRGKKLLGRACAAGDAWGCARDRELDNAK